MTSPCLLYVSFFEKLIGTRAIRELEPVTFKIQVSRSPTEPPTRDALNTFEKEIKVHSVKLPYFVILLN